MLDGESLTTLVLPIGMILSFFALPQPDHDRLVALRRMSSRRSPAVPRDGNAVL